MTSHRLRLAAQPLGIVKIDASEAQALIQFGPKTSVDPARIIELVQRQRNIKLAGQDKLRVEIKAAQIPARSDAIRAVLRALK
ncbi:Transcription-repair-coupling factor [compost metagenome]